MPGRKLGVAFIGGGWVTTNRHLPAARKQPELDLRGLVTKEAHFAEIDRSKLERTFGIRHFGSDLTEPWFRDEVDVAVIGTPPDTHYELVMRCLGMGKHVLVEKPFALRLEHADTMIREAERTGLKLGLVHNFQFIGACRRARKVVRSGRLGELRGIYGFQSSNHRRRLPRWYKDLPLGLFTDESPHLIYVLTSFLESVAEYSASVGPRMAHDDNTPRYVAAQLVDTDGIPASLQMCFDGAVSEWHVVLVGSERTLLVDLFRDILIELANDGTHKALDVLRTSWSAVRSHVAGFVISGMKHASGRMDYGNRELFGRFVRSVLDDAPLSGISARDGRAVVDVMERIRSDSYAGSELPLRTLQR